MLSHNLGWAVVILSILLAAANAVKLEDESAISKALGMKNSLMNSGSLQADNGKACKPGRKRVKGLCVPCSAGTYSPRGLGDCIKCPIGKSSKVGQAQCSSCAEGTYNDEPGRASCKECPPGKENRIRGSVQKNACITCPAGTSSKDGVKCVPCSSGSFASSQGSSACEQCNYGTISVWNKTLSPTRGPTKCTECPAGRYRTEIGGDYCEPCWPGSANAKSGARYCKKCSPGRYADKFGQKQCTPCPGGSTSPFYQSQSKDICIPCPVGTRTGYDRCHPCEPGTFSGKVGSTRCEHCPTGWYTPKNTSVRCMQCPAGHYTNVTGSRVCIPCPVNTYAPSDGASSCSSCIVGFSTGGKTGQTQCSKIPLHVNTTQWTELFVATANERFNPPASCDKCNDRFNPRIGSCVEMRGTKGILFSVHEVNYKEPTRLLAILKRDDDNSLEYTVYDQVKFCPTVVDRQISFALTFDGVQAKHFNVQEFKQAASIFFSGMKPDDVEVYSCSNASAARQPRPQEVFEDLTTVDNPKPDNHEDVTGPTGLGASEMDSETGVASGSTGTIKFMTGATGATGPKLCGNDLKRCPNSGLYVKRDPENNCEFSPCVSLTGYETGASGITGVEEVVEPANYFGVVGNNGTGNINGIGFLVSVKIEGYTLKKLLGTNREQNLNIIQSIVGTIAGVVGKNETRLPRVDFVKEHYGEVHVGVWISCSDVETGIKIKNHFQGIMNRVSHLVNLFKSAGFGKVTKVAFALSKYVGFPVEELNLDAPTGATGGSTGLSSDDVTIAEELANSVHNRIDKLSGKTQSTGGTGGTGGDGTGITGNDGAGLLEDINEAQEHLESAKKELQSSTGATGEAEDDESVFSTGGSSEGEGKLAPAKRVKYKGTGSTGATSSETGLEERELEDNIALITECSKQPVSYWCDSSEGRMKCGLTEKDCEAAGDAEAENLGKPDMAEEATGITGPGETGADDRGNGVIGKTGSGGITEGATGASVIDKAQTGVSASGATGQPQKMLVDYSTGSGGGMTGSATANHHGSGTGLSASGTGIGHESFNDDDDFNKFSHEEPEKALDAVSKASNKFWAAAIKQFVKRKDDVFSECELQRLVLHSSGYKKGVPAKVIDVMTHVLHEQVLKLDQNKDGHLSGEEIMQYAHHHAMPHYLKVATISLEALLPRVGVHKHLNENTFVKLLMSKKGFPLQLATEIYNEFKGADETVDKHEIAKFLMVEKLLSKHTQFNTKAPYDACKNGLTGSSGPETEVDGPLNEPGSASGETGLDSLEITAAETGSGTGTTSEASSESPTGTVDMSGSGAVSKTGTENEVVGPPNKPLFSRDETGLDAASKATAGAGSSTGPTSEFGSESETDATNTFGPSSGSTASTGPAGLSESKYATGSEKEAQQSTGSERPDSTGGTGGGKARIVPIPVPDVETTGEPGSNTGSASGNNGGNATVLPVPVPYIGNGDNNGEEIIIPSPVPDVGSDVAGVIPDLQSFIEKSSKPISQEYCARVTLHGLTAASTTSYKNMVRKLKVDFVTDKKLSDLMDLYGVKSDDIIVSECRFCREKNESKLPVSLTAWGSFATGPELKPVPLTAAPKPKRTTTEQPIIEKVVATTTTPAPKATVAPREEAPIHVDDCVRTNTADHFIISHDHSVGKVVEVFQTDLIDSKEWWIKVFFRKEKTLPFALKEVVQVPCEKHGFESETFRTGMKAESGATGTSSSTGATGVDDIDDTGSTGVSPTGSETGGSTGATASSNSIDEAGTGSDWSEQATFSTGATASESDEGLVVVPEVTYKEKTIFVPRVITAQEAVDNSKKQLIIQRSKRDALESAISFLRAARHRDAAFVRAVKTDTHIIGYDNILQQVEELAKRAKMARAAYAEALKMSNNENITKRELNNLDAETNSKVLKLVETVRFTKEECANAEQLFHVCPNSFACKIVAGGCTTCSDCESSSNAL